MKIDSDSTLDHLLEAFGDAGEDMVIRDRFSRYWLIGSSEDGDWYATSFRGEDDDPSLILPTRLERAPIDYPATLITPLEPRSISEVIGTVPTSVVLGHLSDGPPARHEPSGCACGGHSTHKWGCLDTHPTSEESS